MKIEIVIVDHEGELWFELDGVKFDTFNAIWELDQQELQVIRDGEVITRARVTEARGDAIFRDYDENSRARIYGSALHAEDFRINDHLVIEAPDGFDFLNDLRRSGWFHHGLIATIPVGKQMSMEELRALMAPELARTEQSAQSAQVIRFRRGK